MKKSKILSKILATILSILMICCSLPITASAASNYITDIGNNSATFGVISGSLSQVGHELHYAKYSGRTYIVFCAQKGVNSPVGKVYDASEMVAYKNSPEYHKIAQYIYFGYTMIYGDGLPSSTEAYRAACATQEYVWEALGQTSSGNRNTWNSTYMSSSIYSSWLSQTEQYYKLYNETDVSFHNSTITLNYGESKTITDTNGVLKYYPSFSKVVEGIKYEHTNGSNTLVLTATASVNKHSLSFDTRDYSIYQLLPSGASYDSDTMNYVYFQFYSGNVQNLIFSNFVDPSIFAINVNVEWGDVELTKEDNYGAACNGAVFGLYTDKACTQLVSKATSDGSKVKWNYLAPATYYAKELSAPTGFLLDDTVVTLTVKNDNTTTKTITNDEPTGTITLTKTLDTEKTNGEYGDVVISEATYSLYAAEKITSALDSHTFYEKDDRVSTKTITANNGTSGTITWSNLPLGSYYIVECDANGNDGNPKGTFVDEEIHRVTLTYKDQVTPVIINNTNSVDKVYGMKLNIFKTGTNGNTSSALQGVEGAEFSIKLNADYQNALKQGYSYSEIWAYQDENGTWIGIDAYGNEVEIDQARAKAANAIAHTYQVQTTDADGYAYFDYLPYGQFICKETKTPVDYNTASDFIFSITTDSTLVSEEKAVKYIAVNNTPFTAPVKILKKDADSGKTVTLSSATFKIRATENIYDTTTGELIYSKGDYIEYKVGTNHYSEFMTNSDGYVIPAKGSTYATTNDESGTVTTPFKLSAGEYEIVEITNPEGFLIAEDTTPFTITSVYDYDTDTDGDTVVVVNFTNEQPKGKLVINKNVVLRNNMDLSLINNIDFTQISYKLVATEDIIDMADGEIVYEEGEEVGTYYLEADGTLTVDNLWIGRYSVTEVSTISGAVIDDTAYDVVFTYEDNTTKEYTVEYNLDNYTTEVDVDKTDITGELEIEGAELTVIDAEGNIVDSWTSTNESHKIEGLVVDQTYTLTEEYASNGFTIANEVQFVVVNTTEIQQVKMLDKAVFIDKQNISGSRIAGTELTVTSSKTKNIVDKWTVGQHIVDITDTVIDEISNNGTATITVDGSEEGVITYVISANTDTNEYLVTKKSGDVIDYYIVDANGNETSHMCRGLIEGQSYTLTETVTVDGYVTATSVDFEVTGEKVNQTVTMIDKQLVVSKTDLVTGEELPGAELVITDADGNEIDSWTSTDEVHYVSGLTEGETYTLTETSCPYGYEIAESVTFTVSTEKETQKVVMQDMPILSTVLVNKVDSATGENIISKDFEFTIYEDEDCTIEITTVNANTEEGTASFEDLRYGTFYIKETKAPTGYGLSDEVVEIVINDEGVYASGEEITEENDVYSIEYQNTLLPSVFTGDSNSKRIYMYLTMAGIAVIFIIAMIIVRKKTKK